MPNSPIPRKSLPLRLEDHKAPLGGRGNGQRHRAVILGFRVTDLRLAPALGRRREFRIRRNADRQAYRTVHDLDGVLIGRRDLDAPDVRRRTRPRRVRRTREIVHRARTLNVQHAIRKIPRHALPERPRLSRHPLRNRRHRRHHVRESARRQAKSRRHGREGRTQSILNWCGQFVA